MLFSSQEYSILRKDACPKLRFCRPPLFPSYNGLSAGAVGTDLAPAGAPRKPLAGRLGWMIAVATPATATAVAPSGAAVVQNAKAIQGIRAGGGLPEHCLAPTDRTVPGRPPERKDDPFVPAAGSTHPGPVRRDRSRGRRAVARVVVPSSTSKNQQLCRTNIGHLHGFSTSRFSLLDIKIARARCLNDVNVKSLQGAVGEIFFRDGIMFPCLTPFKFGYFPRLPSRSPFLRQTYMWDI